MGGLAPRRETTDPVLDSHDLRWRENLHHWSAKYHESLKEAAAFGVARRDQPRGRQVIEKRLGVELDGAELVV